MEYTYWATHAIGAVILTVVVSYLYSWNYYRKYKFPPSPPGRLPLIGHAHLMPNQFPGDKTKEWGYYRSLNASNFQLINSVQK
jgi:hypothetical protein